jgi:hypothetical protein
MKEKESEAAVLGDIITSLSQRAQEQQQNQQHVTNAVQSVDACIHDLLIFIDNELLNLRTVDNENLLNDLIGIISNIKSYAITTSKKAHRAQAALTGKLEEIGAVITVLAERQSGLQTKISDFQALSEKEEDSSREPGERPITEKTKREYQKIVTDSE